MLKVQCDNTHTVFHLNAIHCYFVFITQHVKMILHKDCFGLTAEEVLRSLSPVQNFIPAFVLVSVLADGVKLMEIGQQWIQGIVQCSGTPTQSL